MTTGFNDFTCPCGVKVQWVGQMGDPPPCSGCGRVLDTADVEAKIAVVREKLKKKAAEEQQQQQATFSKFALALIDYRDRRFMTNFDLRVALLQAGLGPGRTREIVQLGGRASEAEAFQVAELFGSERFLDAYLEDLEDERQS